MHMLPTDLQQSNERRYSRKHINGYIDTAIRQDENSEKKVHKGVVLVKEWLAYWAAPFNGQCSTEKYYISKNKRLAQVALMDVEQLVRDVFVGTAYIQEQELFVSVTAQLANKIGFDDHAKSIQTVAEIVAVLCDTDAFDIIKGGPESSLMMSSRIPLPNALIDAIVRSLYLPPMVCKPSEVKSNFESPYLTHNDCLILGKGNAHTEDICLDTINIQNSVALKLDLEFLKTVEEAPNPDKPLDTLEKRKNWSAFKSDSYELYSMLAKQGNQFWLTNKVDKRGRKYAQGYHVTSQGSCFKKAMLELYHEEYIKGAPHHDD